MKLPHRIMVQAPMAFDYELSGSSKPRFLVLLLHGFDGNGHENLRKIAPALPSDCAVLSPNAPFPVPKWNDGRISLGFSWYFYEPSTQEYYIDMGPAVEFLASGVQSLGFGDLPKILIGFSQGGYLAPVAAQKLSGVQQVIGIGCEFLHDEIRYPVTFRIDGIAGGRDEIIPLKDSRKSHEELVAKGVKGIFHELAGSGHGIDDAVRETLKKILADV